jgi:protein Jumonji
VTKQPEKPAPKKRGRKSNQELAEIAARHKLAEAKQVEEAIEKIEKLKKLESQALAKKTAATVTKSPAVASKPQVQAAPTSNANQNKSSEQQPKASVSSPAAKETPRKEDDDDFVKGFDSAAAKPMTSPKASINLLPSKEESEKIFGIASVTLAQSCGPLDTKCTLGKCGSVHVHKPPVGPTVLTESALGASLSPKDRRKSKVNMTRDQIQKWLEEASWTPIPDDEGETVDLKATSKASTPSIGFSKSGDDSQSSSAIREKVFDHKSPSISSKDASRIKLLKAESPITTKFLAKVDDKIETNFPLKTEDGRKQSQTKLNSTVDQKKNANKLSLNSTTNSGASSSFVEKKAPVYQTQQQHQRRTPVYKTDAKPNTPKLTPILPKSFGAFSPENEHSIYSFDREDDDVPIPTTPFRRSNSKAEGEIFPKPSTPSKQPTQPSHVSLTLSPEDNKKSASISVELSDEAKKENEKAETNKDKDGDNDSDSEGHTFYIPLQASNVSGSKTIQGVAVKLGTEGAEGPNQRIIMHAKLVTKPRANAAPLPESMSNVQELVKSLMANKETSKALPCATVQPRFKSADGGETSMQPEPSTSSMPINQRNAPKLGWFDLAVLSRGF